MKHRAQLFLSVPAADCFRPLQNSQIKTSWNKLRNQQLLLEFWRIGQTWLALALKDSGVLQKQEHPKNLTAQALVTSADIYSCGIEGN